MISTWLDVVLPFIGIGYVICRIYHCKANCGQIHRHDKTEFDKNCLFVLFLPLGGLLVPIQ